MKRRPDEDDLEPQFPSTEAPDGIDRRGFMMRSAMIGAVAVLAGCPPASAKETAARAASGPSAVPDVKLSPDLDVVRRSKGR
jgi:L-serine dehydratase